MQKEIHAITRHIDNNQAVRILSSTAGVFKPQVQRLVYYPYLWVDYLYSVKTFLGRRSIRASILVDLVHNIAATADFFDSEKIIVEEESLIPGRTNSESAIKTAETYLLHSAIHKMKSLLLPSAVLRDKIELYKPFLIVKCTDRRRRSFHVLLDAVTGTYEILNLGGDKT